MTWWWITLVEQRSLLDFGDDPGLVVEYCKHAMALRGSQRLKAVQFVRYSCIRYVGDVNEYRERCSFVCLPLNTRGEVVDEFTGRVFLKEPFVRDYNFSIYTLSRGVVAASASRSGAARFTQRF